MGEHQGNIMMSKKYTIFAVMGIWKKYNYIKNAKLLQL